MTVLPPTATEAGTFQVDFQSLIKVLGENLYANPKAAVRELIQNANDSCVRRLSAGQQFQPAIQVTTRRDERLLIFDDNGAGMTQSDIRQYLASIGGGRTRSERSRLSTEDPEAARMLIGQFGIGFLSTFVIADQVVVDTCSIEGGEPLRWTCQGTTEYQITPSDRTQPGTRVTLHLKSAHFDLLDEETLMQAIVHYADFIAFPITLNQQPRPVNRMHAPWHGDGSRADYSAYIKHRYGIIPLALEPVHVQRDDLIVQGVLFIPPRSADWKRRLRSIDIFQKRMFVNEDLNILPEWAGFISGVLDCATLDLVASRETAISERPSYRALQDYLGEAVAAFIRRLAEQERTTFQEVINQHDWAVKWGAIRNDFFFDHVRDLIPIGSDSGPLSLPGYLQRVPERLGGIKTIYYVPGDQTLGQQQSTIFRARGVPIFKVDMVDEQFLKKYVERSHNLSLRQMVSGVVELMEFADGPGWRTLEARYQAMGITARAVRFYPADVPAMVVRQEEYDQEHMVTQVMDGVRTVLDFVGRVGREVSDAYGLCFNTDNPMVQRLAAYDGDPYVLETALRAVHSSALLAAGIELTPETSQQVASSQMRIIELLLDQANRIDSGQTVGAYAPSSFAMPESMPPMPEPPDYSKAADERASYYPDYSKAADERASYHPDPQPPRNDNQNQTVPPTPTQKDGLFTRLAKRLRQ